MQHGANSARPPAIKAAITERPEKMLLSIQRAPKRCSPSRPPAPRRGGSRPGSARRSLLRRLRRGGQVVIRGLHHAVAVFHRPRHLGHHIHHALALLTAHHAVALLTAHHALALLTAHHALALLTAHHGLALRRRIGCRGICSKPGGSRGNAAGNDNGGYERGHSPRHAHSPYSRLAAGCQAARLPFRAYGL